MVAYATVVLVRTRGSDFDGTERAATSINDSAQYSTIQLFSDPAMGDHQGNRETGEWRIDGMPVTTGLMLSPSA